MLEETANKSDSELLIEWYEDSLNLILPKNRKQSYEPLETPARNWKSCLGVLNLTSKGEVLWSYGDTRSCHAYMAENNIQFDNHDAVKVETFNDGLIIRSIRADIIRLVYIDHQSTMALLQDVVPNIELTNAELHLLMQILSGFTLKDAAKADHVSYETKRSQFKSLASRTGFRTQSEVIRMSLMALNAQVLDSVDSAHTGQIEESKGVQEFFDLYYPKIFRYHRISINPEHTLRVIDAGPITGKPIIFAHSQTLPPPNQFNTDWLSENNIRLLIPLREGFLQRIQVERSNTEHLERGATDLEDTINMFCGGVAKVVANSCGTAYAIEIAKRNPELFESLTITTLPYLGKYASGPIDNVVSGFKNLALKSKLILDKTYTRYVKKMSTAKGMLEVLSSAYKQSPSDMKIFSEIIHDPIGHSWMYESYRLSQQSVTNDIILGGTNIWEGTQKLKVPNLCIHGVTDPINSISDARKIQSQIANSEFVELPDEGQSFFRTRFKDIICFSHQDWLKSASSD